MPAAAFSRPFATSSSSRSGRPPVPSVVELYFDDINRTPLLNAREERALALRILGGDLEARDLMVQANLRLVVNIARKYMGRGVELLDLIAEGNLGLLRAVQDFDPGRNCRFSTYATHWIRQAISLAVVRTGQTIRIPAYMVSLLSHWRRAAARLREELGRNPTHEEVAERLKLPPSKVEDVRKAFRTLQKPGAGLDNGTELPLEVQLRDVHSRLPDELMIEDEDRHYLLKLVDRMNEREATILRWRFGLDGEESLTLEEIGRRLGVTRERVRQIETKALVKLRKRLGTGSQALAEAN